MKQCPGCGSSCTDSAAFCHNCGDNLSDAPVVTMGQDPLKGRVLADKYKLLEKIGEGGMGVVYRAEHTVLEKTVAVKILHKEFLSDETAVERFRHEARAASRMNHPNSISVIDFGETPDGLFYLVTEFLRGDPLSLYLEKDGTVDLPLTMEVMRQVLAAMEEAESLGIVHRDLKPENIFVERLVDGSWLVKVLDFGIAKRVDAVAANLTTPGMVCGTPEYMAPEQARGEIVDHRADIYSLGVIWYEMLTATNPFERGSAAETLVAHLQQEPRPPSEIAPDRKLPESLDALVLWALAKKREDRYESMHAFRDRLEAWRQVNLASEDTDLYDVSFKKVPAAVIMDDAPALVPDPPEPALAPKRAPSPSGTADLSEFVAKKVPPLVEPSIGKRSLRDSMGTDDTLAAVQLTVPGPGADAMVGRKSESAKAQEVLMQGGVVGVVGEAGAGKSTLIETLVRKASQQGFRVIYETPDSSAAECPMYAVRKTTRALMEFEPDQSLTMESLTASMDQVGLFDDEKAGLADLLEVSDPARQALNPDARQRERTAAFRALVLSSARKSPLLLVFDDVDGMDHPSRAILFSLFAELVVPNSADAIAAVWTSTDEKVVGEAKATIPIKLPSLDNAEARRLVDQWSARLGADQLLDAHLTQTGGNPFFIEQMARVSAEGGPSHTLTRRMDLVDMRLERVAGLQRQILQLAAVRGVAFTPDEMASDLTELRKTLAASAIPIGPPGSHPQPALTENDGLSEYRQLRSDVAKNLEQLRRQGYLGFKGKYWELGHDLFRKAIEAGMPAEIRRQHHSIYFNARRTTMLSGLASTCAAWVARHAVEAQEERAAVEALQVAGCQALWNMDHGTAVRHLYQSFDRIRRLWAAGGVGEPGLTDDMVSIARQLAEAMAETGQAGAAAVLLGEILGLLGDENHLIASVLLDLGRLYHQTGKPDQAVEELKRALERVRMSDSPWLTAEIMGQLAQALARRGDLSQAVELLDEGIRISEKAFGAIGEHAWQYRLMTGQLLSAWGRTEEAENFMENALDTAENAKSLRGRLRAREALAQQLRQQRRREEAMGHVAAAVTLASQWGDRGRVADLSCLAGELMAELGDGDTARKYFERAYGQSVSVNHAKAAERAKANIAKLEESTKQQ